MARTIEQREGRRRMRLRQEIDAFSNICDNVYVMGGVKYQEVGGEGVRSYCGKIPL